MSEWSHLPNAKYIDRIIAHVKANPTAWAAWRVVYDAAYEAAYEAAGQVAQDAARGAAQDAAWRVAQDAAWRVAQDAAQDAAWRVAQDAARGAVRGAPWDALLALVAWDYAGDLMDLPAEQVKVLAILGDQAAILMYSAIEAMETTQELV